MNAPLPDVRGYAHLREESSHPSLDCARKDKTKLSLWKNTGLNINKDHLLEDNSANKDCII